MNKLFNYNKYIFFTALLYRLWHALYWQVYGNDTFSQQFAAENFISGLGVTLTKIHGFDLSSVFYQPLDKWPYTVTILQAAFYSVIQDWIISSVFLTSISVILFLLAVKKTIGLFALSRGSEFFLWILLLTNPLLFHEFGVTDWLGLCAYAWSVYFFVFLLNRKECSLSMCLGISFLFYLPAFFRYQYYPLVLLFPIAYFIWSFLQEQVSIRRQAIILLAATAFLFVVQLILFHSYSGKATLPLGDTGQLHPQNLLKADPFLIKSFLRADYFIFKFPSFSEQIRFFFFFFNLLFLVLVSFGVLKKCKSLKMGVQGRETDYLKIVLLTSTLVFFIFLAFLSLRYEPQVFPLTNFTYVSETRYYAPVMYLLVLVMLLLFKQRKPSTAAVFLATVTLLVNGSLWGKSLYNCSTGEIPVYQMKWAVADRTEAKATIEQHLSENNRPVLLSWHPTEYIILNHYKNDTYIADDYQLLFSNLPEKADALNIVYATETSVLTQKMKIRLEANRFVQVYTKNSHIIFLRKAR